MINFDITPVLNTTILIGIIFSIIGTYAAMLPWPDEENDQKVHHDHSRA